MNESLAGPVGTAARTTPATPDRPVSELLARAPGLVFSELVPTSDEGKSRGRIVRRHRLTGAQPVARLVLGSVDG